MSTTAATGTGAMPPVEPAAGCPCPPWCQDVDAFHTATGYDHAAELGATPSTRQWGYAAVTLRRDAAATSPYLTLRTFSVTPADEDGAVELDLTVQDALRLAAQLLKATALAEQDGVDR